APRVAFERRHHPMIALTILSPAYNLTGAIDRFIKSVGEQTVDVPCEIIVVDDGSTDGTLERGVAAASALPASMDALVLHVPRPARVVDFVLHGQRIGPAGDARSCRRLRRDTPVLGPRRYRPRVPADTRRRFGLAHDACARGAFRRHRIRRRGNDRGTPAGVG